MTPQDTAQLSALEADALRAGVRVLAALRRIAEARTPEARERAQREWESANFARRASEDALRIRADLIAEREMLGRRAHLSVVRGEVG